MGDWRKIRFICSLDNEYKGKELSYSAAQNPLTGDWCYMWSYSNSMWIAESLRAIKKTVNGIRKKEKILEDTFGAFKFKEEGNFK